MQIYVAATKQAGDGSLAHPFQTISEAAEIAMPGDEVIVAPGVYRERVVPANGGTETRRIIYRSQEPGGAVLSGAEQVADWRREGPDIWKAEIPNGIFPDGNPFLTLSAAKRPAHLGRLYMNGRPLRELLLPQAPEKSSERIFSPEGSSEHTFSSETPPGHIFSKEETDETPVWYAAPSADRRCAALYVRLPGLDPNEQDMEIGVRTSCFAPERNGVGYLTLSGFVFRQTASSGTALSAAPPAAVHTRLSRGWVIEDCEIAETGACGLSLGGEPEPAAPARNRQEALLYAAAALSPDTVGAHRVRRCVLRGCAQAGIVGNIAMAASRIEAVRVSRADCGLLLRAPIDVTIRQVQIDRCTQGIFLDGAAQGVRISQSVFYDNPAAREEPAQKEGTRERKAAERVEGQDIAIAASHGPILLDCNVFASGTACRLEGEGIAFVHNLILGGIRYGAPSVTGTKEALSLPPYFFPHSLRVRGCAPSGTDELWFCGNVFAGPDAADGPEALQSAAAAVSGNPQSVFLTGNFFAGGRSYTEETPEGEFILQNDFFDRLTREETEPLSTASLGRAARTEQLFEAPDGREIVFNRDFFGVRRALRPLAGPFEHPAKRIVLCAAAAAEPADGRGAARRAQTEAEARRMEGGRDLKVSFALTGCEAIRIPYDGAELELREIFVRENTAWLHAGEAKELLEIDCRYGIVHSVSSWTVEAPELVDVRKSGVIAGIAHCIAALFTMLSGNAKDAGTRLRREGERAVPLLETRGITMRMTGEYLKFIREKRFLSVEETIAEVLQPSADVVGIMDSNAYGEKL